MLTDMINDEHTYVSPLKVFKAEALAGQNAILRRQKREWIIPPAKLTENVDYTKKEFIAKVRALPL